MEIISNLLSNSIRKISPADLSNEISCILCLENGAVKRKCCNADFCDHCYTKNGQCPNCDVFTKQEKRTGATYVVNHFSEHEECRCCLDPGLIRRCCKNYYCDECYYKVTYCRSCGTPVNQTEKNDISTVAKAATVSVVLGWFITIFVILSVLAFLSVWISSEAQTPTGIYDYKCYGFFRSCDLNVCIQMESSVADGTSAISPLTNWTYCDLNSQYKLNSPACIFDNQLYLESKQTLGFDVCADTFNQGIYVFQDTFEYWLVKGNHSSNLMKSGTWSKIVNGLTTDYCGAGEGVKALSFSGENYRYAMTIDLDMSSGGKVEAMIYMPPIGSDVDNQYCKTGYIGIVNVDYSINNGYNWTTFASYSPANYRQSKYFKISVTIPDKAKSSHTRFRFDQPIFESARDNWALDDVRVLRFLPNKWQKSNIFQTSLQSSLKQIQRAQCCADTDWCQHRLSENERHVCREEWNWYKDSSYLIRFSEIFICFTTLIGILKFIYVSFQNWFMKKRFPFQDEVTEFLLLDEVSKRIPPKYRMKKNQLDYISEIHYSAREEEKMRHKLADEEGEGAMKRRQKLIEKEKKMEEKKIKKAKKKLEERMKMKNFKNSTIEIPMPQQQEKYKQDNNIQLSQVSEIEQFEKMIEEEEKQKTKFAEDKLIDEKNRAQRQNVAILRTPFELEVDEQLIHVFTYVTVLIFVIHFLLVLSFSKSYSITEPFEAYGSLRSNLNLNSILLVFFAMYCDIKEIYHTLKYIIPYRAKDLPLVTIDSSE
eukprot:gene5313-7377_t